MTMIALAVAASACAGTVVLPTSGFTCTYQDATTTMAGADCPPGEGAVSQLGAGGLSFSISSGGIVLHGNSSLLEGTFGQVATAMPVGTAVSYSYDFFLTETVTDPTWALEMELTDTGSGVIASTGFITGSFGTTRTEFANSGTLTTSLATKPNDVIDAIFILDLTGVTGGTPFTTVEIPAGTSIDFDTITTASSGTPEPSTLGLFTIGAALLVWKRFKRRNS